MKILGLVAEYNPFHNGHLYHMQMSKHVTGMEKTIVVMSGNFTQRGEPAVCDKWLRTRMALESGADLVIELPVYFASAGADYFAGGAIRLLHSTGLVKCLCFGSESGDLKSIRAIGKLLSDEPEQFKMDLKKLLGQGFSFAVSRERSVAKHMELPNGLLSGANNILGVEYCKALYKLASDIEPFTVVRGGGAPDDKTYTSAEKIRMSLSRGRLDDVRGYMPPYVYFMLSAAVGSGETAFIDNYSSIFQYKLRECAPSVLREIVDMGEGLENRFRRLCGEYFPLTELLDAVKTKRYTLTRIRRAALHTVLGIENSAMSDFARTGPLYIRVLGFRRQSSYLLSEMESKASLPVITNIKHAEKILSADALVMLRKEIETTDFYVLAQNKKRGGNRAPGYEYRMPLVIL